MTCLLITPQAGQLSQKELIRNCQVRVKGVVMGLWYSTDNENAWQRSVVSHRRSFFKGVYISGTDLCRRTYFRSATRPCEDFDCSHSGVIQAKSAKFCLNQTGDAANIFKKQKRLVPSSLLSLSENLPLFE